MKISDFFGRKDKIYLNECICIDTVQEIVYKEWALNSAINLIAKAISNCEFKTYTKNQETKADNYYLFNIEPNPNQNASEFWIKYIYKLIMDNEVLVIQHDNYFYIADSFEKTDKTLKKSVFYNVTFKQENANENLILNKRFSSDDVIYTKLNNESITNIVDDLYSSYGLFLAKALENYNLQRGIKGILKIGGLFSQKFEDSQKMQEYIKKKFENYFKSANAVLPLEDGLEFTEKSQTANTNMNTEEVIKSIDEVLNQVCVALNIPKGIIKGDLAEIKEQTNNFLTYCIDPIANMISNEFNRKYFKKEQYLQGTYLKVDTSTIEHINIFDVSNSLDVLMRIGFSNNELRTKIKEPKLNEKWADEHYITKNYSNAEGGDENE